MMRISQQMLNRNTLANIQARQSDLFNTQRQASSGLRYERASQDTIAASQAMDLKQALAFQQRLEANANNAQDFNNNTEAELSAVNDVMNRVRELAIRAANEVLNEQQLSGLSGELDGLLGSLSDIANTTHEGRYLFGGFQTQQPPFVIEKNLQLDGTALTELSLNRTTARTQVETRSLSTIPAGAFALNGGDLIINGVDIGSFVVNDASRSAEDNAQTLVELINAHTAETGVSASRIAVPSTATALEGIALSNLDSNGQPSAQGIRVQGKGIASVTANLPLLRNENLTLSGTQFWSERLAAGNLGITTVPPGTVVVNGVTVNSAMTFAAGNTPEQNAEEIARALNTVSASSNVRAETDGYGFVKLIGQEPFEISGAPPQIQIPNQLYEQTRDQVVSSGAVSTGGNLVLSSGSLVINGIDIFTTDLTLDAAMTAPQRAQIVAGAINRKTGDSGISAYADSAGQLHFSNSDTHVTAISYRGDSGDNFTQVGSSSLIPLYMSGDQAFSGDRKDLVLAAGQDLDASSFSGLASGDFIINGVNIGAIAPVTPNPGDPAAWNLALGQSLASAINAQSAFSGVSAEARQDNSGGVRLVLSSQGQDIDISSSNPVANTLLAATGLAPGTHVDQKLDIFDTVIRLRDQILNSKYSGNRAESISIQNIKEISDALDQVSANRVELGVRASRGELVANRVAYTQEILKSQLADNQEIDITEVLSRLTQEETALQAAYAVTQRLNDLSLLNFI